jgi:imidazoleglycerol phosphate dehydratase HisB
MMTLLFGDVRKKKIVTPNQFVSHMIEHIAWRMGLSIELEWSTENWKELGRLLGAEIKQFPPNIPSASALGMIDDGSASVAVTLGGSDIEFSAVGDVDLDWFLKSRCEQIDSGKPLIELAQGLSDGLEAQILVQLWSLEDPHHTWEGVYRGIGIALAKIFMPETDREAISAIMDDKALEKNQGVGEVTVLEKGINQATVQRGTAETGVIVGINFVASGKSSIRLDVDESIKHSVRDANQLLSIFARAFDVDLSIDFKATKLSSSHVVMEDIGLVLGRALLEIIKVRMEKYGVNGSGSNLNTIADIQEKNVRVGVSIEGRKFWRLVPEDGDFRKFRSSFQIGHNLYAGLRSEDLDDFIDGLAGGMSASIMVHIRDYSKPENVWPEIFESLGMGLRQSFLVNPYRRGVPPGVKATLA